MKKQKKKKRFHFELTKKACKFTKYDWCILSVITLLFTVLTLYHLGDRKAPETAWYASDGQNILLKFDKDTEIKDISFYTGRYSYYNLSVSGKDSASDMMTTYYNGEIRTCFYWDSISVNSSASQISVALSSLKASLLEMVITDKEGNRILPVNASDYEPLFDEQDLFPERSSYRNSTYFDEIYHARTAYEYIHGITSYENTHPPLGKIFISLGIRIFGMNPFGWRIAGAVFGILMIPAIYAFAKLMFEKTWLTTIVCLTFTFDFMHFAQTRISTIDVYVTFFIILMYYFMYRYTMISFYDSGLKKTLLPLALCGISMGLGCACKWTGCYAGVGLAILFFYHMWRRFREYRHAKSDPDGETDGILHRHVIEVFKGNSIKTLLWCVLFFIIIPGLIYLLSYIPFISYTEGLNLIERMLENQQTMFNYHSGLKATHNYSSHWYQWPTMIRPILFYAQPVTDTISEGISSFGNPAVWWVGIPAASYAVYRGIMYRDKQAGFLLLSYAAQYMPWFLVSRYTFIYHYFPSTPFVVLLIGFCMNRISEIPTREADVKKVRIACIIYCVLVIGLFILFYPVLSGMPVSKSFVSTYLRWSSSWTLVL